MKNKFNIEVMSYEDSIKFAKEWKAPKCLDPNCICNKYSELIKLVGNKGK